MYLSVLSVYLYLNSCHSCTCFCVHVCVCILLFKFIFYLILESTLIQYTFFLSIMFLFQTAYSIVFFFEKTGREEDLVNGKAKY